MDTDGLIDRKIRRFMSDCSVYAYLSMEQAISDSGLTDEQVSNLRTGLVVGSGGALRVTKLLALMVCVQKAFVV